MSRNTDMQNRESEISELPKGWGYQSFQLFLVDFNTVCTRQRQPLLGAVVSGAVDFSPIGAIVAEEWQRTPIVRPNVANDAWVVMPDLFTPAGPGLRGCGCDRDLAGGWQEPALPLCATNYRSRLLGWFALCLGASWWADYARSAGSTSATSSSSVVRSGKPPQSSINVSTPSAAKARICSASWAGVPTKLKSSSSVV